MRTFEFSSTLRTTVSAVVSITDPMMPPEVSTRSCFFTAESRVSRRFFSFRCAMAEKTTISTRTGRMKRSMLKPGSAGAGAPGAPGAPVTGAAAGAPGASGTWIARVGARAIWKSVEVMVEWSRATRTARVAEGDQGVLEGLGTRSRTGHADSSEDHASCWIASRMSSIRRW